MNVLSLSLSPNLHLFVKFEECGVIGLGAVPMCSMKRLLKEK